MSKRTTTVPACAAGLAAGLVLGPVQSALAGHTNSVLQADLDGRSEVATGTGDQRIVGDPNGSGEVYVFGIDGDPTTLCYVLVVDKVAELDDAPGNGRAAHIHRGTEGANGPVEVTLAWPQDGQAADCLTEGEPGKGLDTGEVQEILANPHEYYVNVHNGEHPNGAIRGQLHAGH
ncbi:MAG: CHRD domain-containing protein [Actinomycetota bacterium]